LQTPASTVEVVCTLISRGTPKLHGEGTMSAAGGCSDVWPSMNGTEDAGGRVRGADGMIGGGRSQFWCGSVFGIVEGEEGNR
jgi:hypothetical protein